MKPFAFLRRILLLFVVAGSFADTGLGVDTDTGLGAGPAPKASKQQNYHIDMDEGAGLWGDERPIDNGVLKGIRGRETDEQQFLTFLCLLPHLASEPTSVWADIITDDHYGERRRKLALAVLLRRHVTSQMTLMDLARIVPRNKLFTIAEIKSVDDLDKEPHPRFWLQGNVFFLQMVSGTNGGAGAGFYFVLDRKGKPAKELLFSALRGNASSELKAVRLLDLKTVWDWGFGFSLFP